MGVAEAPTVAGETPADASGGVSSWVPTRHVSFPELVWAHHMRQKELLRRREQPYGGPAEELYRRFEAAFEARYGPITSAYWCREEASGVALTVRTRPWIIPDRIQLHWATDWSTRRMPELTALLYRAETLGVKVTEALRDTAKRVAMQWLFNSMSYMLGFVESGRADDPDAVKAVVESQSKELDKVETYYKNSAGRSGQIIYLGGTLLGLVPLIVIAVVAVLFRAFGTSDVATAAACFSAGGVGALVSVMARMNSARVGLDWEFGKDTLRTLGSLRPFIGAVFGLMTYFALNSGVITLSFGKQTSNNFSFYVLFAFAAGFSERLAQDMLLGSTIDRVLGKEKSQPSPGPEHGAQEPVAAPQSDGAPADLRPAS